MEFIKKHYEKIVLAVVLIGLTAAVGYLLIFIPQKQAELQDKTGKIVNKPATPLPELDTALEDQALQRLQAPFTLDLTTKHRLFNPVLWQITSTGQYQKIESDSDFGPKALKVTAINPVDLTVTYVGSTSAGGYEIKIINPRGRTMMERSRGESVVVHPQGASSRDVVLFKGVEGAQDSPTALLLEWGNTREDFKLPTDPNQPYKSIVGYTADLTYRPDPKLSWHDVHPEVPGTPRIPATSLMFDGYTNKVFDVRKDSVVVSDTSNYKQTILPFSNSSE